MKAAVGAFVLLAASCGGLTDVDGAGPRHEAGIGGDVGSGHDAGIGGAAAGDAGMNDAAGHDGGVPEAPDPCADVGKGPGMQVCCAGQLCRGECSPKDECICYGAGAIGGCPPGAACCKMLVNGLPYGPVCVGPQDCIPE